MLAEDGQYRHSHTLDQFLGQARGDLGVVAARGFRQPQQAMETRQPDGLAESQQPLSIEVQHLVEKPAEVIPMFIRESDTRRGSLLAEILPVPPATDIL